jgi:hypothetical protein
MFTALISCLLIAVIAPLVRKLALVRGLSMCIIIYGASFFFLP